MTATIPDTLTLADAFASLTYANRDPSWAEYERAAPVEQRAIVKRWWEISKQPVTGDTAEAGQLAWFNWHRVHFGFHENDPRRRQKAPLGQGCAPSYFYNQRGEEDEEYVGT